MITSSTCPLHHSNAEHPSGGRPPQPAALQHKRRSRRPAPAHRRPARRHMHLAPMRAAGRPDMTRQQADSNLECSRCVMRCLDGCVHIPDQVGCWAVARTCTPLLPQQHCICFVMKALHHFYAEPFPRLLAGDRSAAHAAVPWQPGRHSQALGRWAGIRRASGGSACRHSSPLSLRFAGHAALSDPTFRGSISEKQGGAGRAVEQRRTAGCVQTRQRIDTCMSWTHAED